MINDDEAKFIKYVKALLAVDREDEHHMRSLIRVVNLKRGTKEKRLRFTEDLAELMLDDYHFNRVLLFAEELLPPKTFSTFRLAVLGSARPAPALIKDFLRPESLPETCLFPPTATLSDLIQFFQKAKDMRYFIIVDEDSSKLIGIVSINDYLRHSDEVDLLTQEGKLDTPVVRLDLFNPQPRRTKDSAPMDEARQMFKKAEKENKRFTELLIVDDTDRPIGLLDEPDLGRWRSGSNA